MVTPTECKHCGLHAVWHTDDNTLFACGTIYVGRGDYWNRFTACVEIVQSRDRIQRALKRLETATRYRGDLAENDQYGAYMRSSTSSGWCDAIELEKVIEILRGGDDEV